MLSKIIGYVIAGIICAAFIGVIYVLAKKQMALKEELLKTLTEEQKKELQEASLNNNSLTKGFIAMDPKVGNSKTESKVLFFNTYYPNMMEQFSLADISIPTKTYNEQNLKKGDYIKISLNENGAKVLFD